MKNNKNNLFQKLNKLLEFEDPYDDFDEDYNDYNEVPYKQKLKDNIQAKLFTDEKLTFEEFTMLLEIVTDKFKTCFSSRFGKCDIIFRERTYDERVNISPIKESEEKNNDERE